MKKRNIFTLGLIGSLGIAAPMTFAATPNTTQSATGQQTTNVWSLANQKTITQDDVVNLLNKTNYKNSNIDITKWKIESLSGDHTSFKSHKDFPAGYTIPSTVTKIDFQAFAGIEFPSNFEIPKNVKEIESHAFHNAILSKGFIFKPAITFIKDRTFDHTKIIEKFDIPKTVTEIKQYAFKNSIFYEDFIIPNHVVKFGRMGFQNVVFKKAFSFEGGYTKELGIDFHQKLFWGASFENASASKFNFPIKVLKERVFGVVNFNGEDVVIENNGTVELQKIESLKWNNFSTLNSFTIPNTVINIDKQSGIPVATSNDLYKKVRKNITVDILKKMSPDYFKNNDNTKLPSQFMSTFKNNLKTMFTMFRDYDFNSGYYKIGDAAIKNQTINPNNALYDMENLFNAGKAGKPAKVTIIPDDTNGKITLKINDFNGYSNQIDFVGFKTTHDLKVETENSAIDQALIDEVAPTKNHGINTKTAVNVVASDLVAPTSKTTANGTLSYAVKHVEPSKSKTDGTTVTTTIEVSSSVTGTKKGIYTVEVSGFLATVDYEKQLANAEIDKAITENIPPTINAGSDQTTAANVTTNDLIAPSPTGTLTYNITNVQTSTITVDGSTITVTIGVTSSVVGSKTTNNTYDVEVSGFTTTLAKAISDTNAKIDVAVKAKLKPTLANGANAKTAANISINDLIAPSSTSALTYRVKHFEPNSVNKHDGTTVTTTIEVSSSVTGTKKGIYTVEVSGFLATADYEKQLANVEIDKAITENIPPTIHAGSDQTTAANVTTNDLIAPSPTGTLTYSITNVQPSTTTTDGTTVTATVEVSSKTFGTAKKTYIIDIAGFMSTSNHQAKNANSEIDQAVTGKVAPSMAVGKNSKTAANVTTNDLVAPTSKTTANGTLSYAVKHVEPSKSKTDGTTVTTTIEVSSSVTGTKKGIYTVEVSGFLATADYEKQLANAEIDKAITENIPPTIHAGSDQTTAANVTTNDLIAPSPTGTLTYSITNVQPSTTTTDGTTVTATVEVSSKTFGTAKKTYIIDIAGFMSTSNHQAKNANSEIDQAVTGKVAPSMAVGKNSKTAANVTTNDLVAPTSKTTANGTLSYAVKHVEPSKSKTDGTTVTTTIEVSSSVTGTKKGIYTVEVSGFLATADYEKQLANAEIDKAITENIPPTIHAGSDQTTAANVTTNDLIAPSPTGTLTYSITNVQPSTTTADGSTITVTIGVTSSVIGSKTTNNTYDVEVSGFTTIAHVAANLDTAKTTATNSIDNIKPGSTLIVGASLNGTEQTDFNNAITSAKQAITQASTVTDVTKVEADEILNVTTAKDALDNAINIANNTHNIKQATTKANQDQKASFDAISKWAKKLLKVGMPFMLPSEIASKIKDIKTFEDNTNLKFPSSSLRGSTTVTISPSPSDSNGTIKFSVILNTPGATNVLSNPIPFIIGKFESQKQRSNFDNNKKTIINKLDHLVDFPTEKSNKKLPSEISASIKDVATLKQYTGWDLKEIKLHPGEKIEIVSAKPNDKTGEIEVSFRVVVKGSSKSDSNLIVRRISGFNTKSSSKLSKGVIVAISLGSVAFLGLGFLLFRLIIKSKTK